MNISTRFLGELDTLPGHGVLLNTSFNLKGLPIVETLEDAILTLEKSDIKYLYKP